MYLHYRVLDVQILVGTNDLYDPDAARYAAKKIIIHEEYNRTTYANSIGLIQVDKMELNELVQPIKISREFVDGDASLLATGWGEMEVSLVRVVLYRSQ